MQVFKKIGDQLPNLRRKLSIDLDEVSRAEVVDILRSFTSMCLLPSGESEPHPQNQKILYNFGQPLLSVSCIVLGCVCVCVCARTLMGLYMYMYILM